ncbi:MAG: OmpH family outer membrane protein [Rubrimonas sp.]|uniref:OmpH family outer membrane protein n=1 Tax=Rubrimonas sp. TaxID=2036015 RepID=UPI002FDE508A
MRLIVVDWEAALAQSQAGRALDALERNERREARATLDALKAALEAEEAELTALKDTLPRADFDERVRDFDQRVRRARRSAQEISASLQSRFSAAREALRGLALPELQAVMAELDADVALDARRVLAASPERDATEALVDRLDAAHPAQRALELLPPPEAAAAPGGGAP